jgi:hypothetical protein
MISHPSWEKPPYSLWRWFGHPQWPNLKNNIVFGGGRTILKGHGSGFGHPRQAGLGWLGWPKPPPRAKRLLLLFLRFCHWGWPDHPQGP